MYCMAPPDRFTVGIPGAREIQRWPRQQSARRRRADSGSGTGHKNAEKQDVNQTTGSLSNAASLNGRVGSDDLGLIPLDPLRAVVPHFLLPDRHRLLDPVDGV